MLRPQVGVDALRLSTRATGQKRRRFFVEHAQAYAFIVPALLVLTVFDMITKVITGKATPEDAIKDAGTKANKILQEAQ